MSRKNSDWLEVFFNWTQDLYDLEILVVGEKDGRQFRYSAMVDPREPKMLEISRIVNDGIKKYIEGSP